MSFTKINNYTDSQNITITYSYNNLNQLAQRSVNAGSDQVTWTYTYDNNGNMTLEKKGTVEKRYFSYNFDDRMTHVEVNYADIYGYEYDALGRRLISTDNNGNKTLYYYDGFQVIIEKTKPSGSSSWTTAKVYTLADESIGFIISERNSELGQDIWYHYDRLGNVMDITQDDGILYTFYEQDSFGIILEGVGEGYHLITKEYNYDIGLYYLNDRWCDPKFGRFTQIGVFSPVFEHPYVYAENAPTIYVDPTGFIFYWVSKKKGPWKIKYNPWERDNRSDIKGGSSNVTISDPLPGTWTVAFCYWYFKRLVIKTRMVESTYNCWKRCKGFYKYSKTEEEQDVYWEHHTEITPAHLIPLGAYSRMGWMCSSGDLPLNWQKVQGGF